MANLRVTGCHFVVPVDVYKKDVCFMFGYSRKEILRILKVYDDTKIREIRKHFKSFNGGYEGLCVIGKFGQILITMPVMPTTADHFDTLAHEIFHGVEGIMSNIGNEHRKDDVDESWAYLIGYLTGQAQMKLGEYYKFAL